MAPGAHPSDYVRAIGPGPNPMGGHPVYSPFSSSSGKEGPVAGSTGYGGQESLRTYPAGAASFDQAKQHAYGREASYVAGRYPSAQQPQVAASGFGRQYRPSRNPLQHYVANQTRPQQATYQR